MEVQGFTEPALVAERVNGFHRCYDARIVPQTHSSVPGDTQAEFEVAGVSDPAVDRGIHFRRAGPQHVAHGRRRPGPGLPGPVRR